MRGASRLERDQAFSAIDTSDSDASRDRISSGYTAPCLFARIGNFLADTGAIRHFSDFPTLTEVVRLQKSRRSRPDGTVACLGRYGAYSLFSPGIQTGAGTRYFGTSATQALHKGFPESPYSGGFGALNAPTPPPGSPYSPLHLEFLANAYSSHHSYGFDSGKSSFGRYSFSSYASKTDDKLPKEALRPLSIKIEESESSHERKSNESGGCSRTNPIAWTSPVQVKRESSPMISTTALPMGNAGAGAVLSASHMLQAGTVVKIEQSSPTSGVKPTPNDVHQSSVANLTTSIGNGSIPVGIAVARQRLPHELGASSGAGGLLTTSVPSVSTMPTKEMLPRFPEVGGGCMGVSMEERSAHLTWPAPGQGPAPALWHYPHHVALESMMGLGGMNSMGHMGGHLGALGGLGGLSPLAPTVGGGVQLVRDASGALILMPATEQFQQVVWGGYVGVGAGVLIPPVQVVGAELLASTTLHHHTQTHSTRLVALAPDPKRPKPTIVKFDECSPQLPDTGFLLYQLGDCRSQGNSPAISVTQPVPPTTTAPCLTPPPDNLPDVQDASNQTDTPILSEEEDVPTNVPLIDNSDNATDTKSFEAKKTDKVCRIVENTHKLEPKQPTNDFKSFESRAKEAEARNETSSGPSSDGTSSSALVIDSDQHLSSDISGEPVLKVKTEVQNQKLMDLSGLELLSNSIEQFENISKSKPRIYDMPNLERSALSVDVQSSLVPPPVMILKTSPKSPKISESESHFSFTPEKPFEESVCVNNSLGGLSLLCALAEQRFREEVGDKKVDEYNSTITENCKNIKVEKIDKEYVDYTKFDNLKKKVDAEPQDKFYKYPFHRRRNSSENKIFKTDRTPVHDRYQFPVRTPAERKSFEKTKKDSSQYSRKYPPFMQKFRSNSMSSVDNDVFETKVKHYKESSDKSQESDVMKELADLQRRYKEKQRELSKLTPKRSQDEPFKRGPGRPRKKTSESFSPASHKSSDFSPSNRSFIKSEDENGDRCRAMRSISPIADSNSSQSSVATLGSSKKRKVGRPKKLLNPGSHIATETIVAKKPKSKSSIVGYLLAAKSRISLSSNKGGIIYSKTNPPRPYEHGKHGKTLKTVKNKKSEPYSSPSSLSEYKYPLGYDVVQKYASVFSGESNSASRMRPKLKAELKVKDYSEEDDVNDWCSSQSNLAETKSQSSSLESLQEVHLKNKLKTDQLALKHKKTDDSIQSKFSYDSSESDSEVKPPVPEEKVEIKGPCSLCLDQLDNTGEIRVLTAMGGLFYAGSLKAVQPPDVYSVTLDGERGNRPHILSREEALRDVILEKCPPSTKDLVPGTRLCAYWSQQYRCLYPGTVAELSSPDSVNDDKFVSVEFDDGDSGRIALEDIRLLQPDYPICEYDPNPLLTLGKRRRQTSGSVDDKKVNTSVSSIGSIDNTVSPILPKLSTDTAVSTSEHSQLENEFGHKERKRLKKHKRDKLKCSHSKSGDENSGSNDFIRKKKKKHKCCDDRCKHRKHHRKHHHKHKKHHHSSSKEQSGSSSDDPLAKIAPPVFKIKDITVNITKTPEIAAPVVPEPEINTEPTEKETPKSPAPKIPKKITLKKKDKPVDSPPKDAEKPKEETTPKKTKVVKKPAVKPDEDSPNKTSVKKAKKRTSSSTSDGGASKMAAFLPAGAQLWEWKGAGHRRPQARGKAKKCFYRSIQRGNEVIDVGDAAVFLSTGKPDRPYIGQVESLWEGWQGNMAVRVRWYYHPEETVGCPGKLTLAGGLFESPHTDENDIQTISHKCEVIQLAQFRKKLSASSDMSDTYYRAGFYNPSLQTLKMESDIPYEPQ